MAKKGRKPKERKGYFYETEENAILQYISAKSETEKNKIFDTYLYPAFTKMIESIIRRYKLFVPDEEFETNFNDTISYLLTKINLYRPEIIGYDEITEEESLEHNITFVSADFFKEKVRNATEEDPEYIIVSLDDGTHYFKKTLHHYKAYSYCGTICRNYLKYKCIQYDKKRKKNTPYDEIFEEINNNENYSTEMEESNDIAERLVKNITSEIRNMIKNAEEFNLNEDEIKVGNAMINIMENWEELLPEAISGKSSSKLQKSAVLYLLREETMMTTHEVRKNMTKYKNMYGLVKKMVIE